jgi:hypothetical protein
MGSSQFDNKRFFAVASILSAFLTLLLVVSAAPPPGSAADLLPYFRAHLPRFVILAVVVLAWVVVSLPVVIAIARLVGDDHPMLASAGALLSAGGILLLGFGTFIFIGAFFALAAANDAAPSAAHAAYQAAVWRNLSFLLSDPGLMTLGAGQLVFGWLAWRGRAFPRYVAALGILGGIAGLLTLAVYQTPALAIVQLLALSITAAAAGLVLFRHDRPTPIESRADTGSQFE